MTTDNTESANDSNADETAPNDQQGSAPQQDLRKRATKHSRNKHGRGKRS